MPFLGDVPQNNRRKERGQKKVVIKKNGDSSKDRCIFSSQAGRI
jgi:hypothetical protein